MVVAMEMGTGQILVTIEATTAATGTGKASGMLETAVNVKVVRMVQINDLHLMCNMNGNAVP